MIHFDIILFMNNEKLSSSPEASCTHHWKIDDKYCGKCKKCGMEQEFKRDSDQNRLKPEKCPIKAISIIQSIIDGKSCADIAKTNGGDLNKTEELRIRFLDKYSPKGEDEYVNPHARMCRAVYMASKEGFLPNSKLPENLHLLNPLERRYAEYIGSGIALDKVQIYMGSDYNPALQRNVFRLTGAKNSLQVSAMLGTEQYRKNQGIQPDLQF